MSVEIYGPLFSAHLIEQAAYKVLKEWLPLYKKEIEGQYEVKLPEIKSWSAVDESYESLPAKAFPAITLVAGGLGKGGSPEKHSNGFYRAGWALGVTVAVQHQKKNSARAIASLYAAAIRGVLLQRRSLGVAGAVADWLDEGYGSQAIAEDRTQALGENVFLVEVDEVVNWQKGPKDEEAPDSVPESYPEITDVDVDVDVEVN